MIPFDPLIIKFKNYICAVSLHRAVHSRQLPCHFEEEICKGLLIVRLHPEQADAERQHAKHKHTDEAYVNVDDSEYVAANQLYGMSQTCKY